MPSSCEAYDVVVVGAGLSGLTSAYWLKRLAPELSVLVLERSGTAGGLTGDWVDHRAGPRKRLQPPMHMIFRTKYPNLLAMVDELGGELSPKLDGFRIVTSDGVAHDLRLAGWASEHLPPPLHAIRTLTRLRLPLRAKWDLAKLVAAGALCADAAARDRPGPPEIPTTLSLESLELLLGMRAPARDFVETVTPSIYNPHPWYTSAPRMAAIAAGTLALERGCLHHHVFARNYNAAFVDRLAGRLRAMGVELRFRAEVRRIDASPAGDRVEAIWVRAAGADVPGSFRWICAGCGAENWSVDRAACTRCGADTTLDRVRSGEIRRPLPSRGWADAERDGLERIACGHLVTAMYPHMIAALLPEGSPLRRHPYVRSFFSSRGNQTQLSIARVYYARPVTDGDLRITGTHNPTFAFNGCQSVRNVFGEEEVDHRGDVVDVLLDVGVVRDAHGPGEQIARIVHDLARVYPAADPSLVEHVSFADLQPSVLYLTEQPAIAGQHRFFATHRTGARNWLVAGCHSGKIGIGMESATESGLAAANAVLEDLGVAARAPVIPYRFPAGARVLAWAGRRLLRWKGAGGDGWERRAGATYSMPPAREAGRAPAEPPGEPLRGRG
ncbi:MAG TPA: FAD-dependent oxidoreductase [Anaeromyxobacter sp.]|nr:FAD-dependent oxidoreductase [Anaeromyxobacter sp.]